MGSACCVAARDRTTTNESGCENLHRNVQYSPSWSFQWDNPGRVAGEEISVNCSSDGVSGNDGLHIKSETVVETAYASEEGSSLDSFRTVPWQKSPISEDNPRILRLPSSDQSISRNFPIEVKESTESPAVSEPFPLKLSPSLYSMSSLSASPLSSQSYLLPAGSTPSRCPRRSPGHHQLIRQVSDSRIPGLKSPNFSISEEVSSFGLPGWSNESTRGSHGGSSDGWSMLGFSELVATSRRERWSFDNESLGFNHDKITRYSSRSSASASIDLQTCGVCSKLLTEKSSWSSHKIITTNDLAVVSVLICGHVYHAECLENMTPEFNKYDPACPVCTFGEKQALKLSEKVLRAGMDLKARNSKRSRNQVVDSDFDGDSIVFDRQKSDGHGRKGLKMSSSSSFKSSLGRPFLRRHFSFGSKGTGSLSEDSTQRKGFFWSKSRKE